MRSACLVGFPFGLALAVGLGVAFAGCREPRQSSIAAAHLPRSHPASSITAARSIAAVACTLSGEADLLELVRARACLVAAPAAGAADALPAALRVELVPAGPEFSDTVSLRVLLANDGATAIPLDLTVDDQRLCFTGAGGGFPTRACELIPTAPANAIARARVMLAPHAVARVDGLGFIKHTAVERAAGNGAVGWFDEPLARGTYDFVATVPLAWTTTPPALRELHTTVSIP
jgi:hypothetical protein